MLAFCKYLWIALKNEKVLFAYGCLPPYNAPMKVSDLTKILAFVCLIATAITWLLVDQWGCSSKVTGIVFIISVIPAFTSFLKDIKPH